MASKDTLFIEFKGRQVSQKDIIDKAKAVWKENGNKVKDLKSVNVYYKPEEGKCYYVLNENSNDTLTGSFEN